MGFCGCGLRPKLARAALHQWEEPCISGTRGSGTVFFSGCTLRCCYCQNFQISHMQFGKEVSVQRLSEIFLELQAQGAHNLNLVSPTPYVPAICEALDLCASKRCIPVIYNTGGYERPETIRMLKNYIDIYLTDMKYCDAETAQRYSGKADYFTYAAPALLEMVRQTGAPRFDSNGLLRSGVIVRHLVLPGQRKQGIRIMEWLADQNLQDKILLSLMRQYTPIGTDSAHPEIHRKVTTFEYQSVVDAAVELGLTHGFMQECGSETLDYTPSFDLKGVESSVSDDLI